MKTTRPTLLILGLVSSALTYLSFYSLVYENYTSGIVGVMFFGGMSVVLFGMAFAEIIESRRKL